MLTQKRLKELLDYNPDTGIFKRRISQSRRNKVGEIAGSINNGYRLIRADVKRYSAHRLAWLYMYGEFPKGHIDHINHDRDDNRIENLRDVTFIENNMNMSLRKTNKSGVIGVYFAKHARKWHARINIKGKQIHLGYYKEKLGAELARRLAEEFYGYHKNHGKA